MATPYPSLDGGDRRPRTGGRMLRMTFNVVGFGAFLAAPIAAAALWLLLTDPVLAREASEGPALIPIVRTLVITLGKALAAVFAYL
jgi:hypothetical protein